MEVKSPKDSKLKIGIIPGHFATSHSHVSAYVDLTEMKCESKMARRAAESLARSYDMAFALETIVCMEGTELVGAYLAEELSTPGRRTPASGQSISVITPEIDSNRQLLFRDNLQKKIWNRHILVLIASITTGKTIKRVLECLSYYSGIPVGIASLFSAEKEIGGIQVNSIFNSDDIPGYESYLTAECPYCKKRQKIDAIINSYGYSKI